MFNVILIAIAAGVNYCKTGDVSGIPKEYHGLKCDKSMIKKVEQFNNICK